jgi:hypothetical protein
MGLTAPLHARPDSGSLVWSKTTPPSPAPPGPPGPEYVEGIKCDGSQAQTGFAYDASAQELKTASGLCFDCTDKTTVQAVACTGGAVQQWKYDIATGQFQSAAGGCLDVWNFAGPRVDVYGCNGGANQKFTMKPNGVIASAGGMCLELTAEKPNDGGSRQLQLWAKPVGGGSMAILLINEDPSANVTATVVLADLNMTGTVQRRNIWERADAGAATSSFDVIVPAFDSVFMVLSQAPYALRRQTV